MTLFLPNKIIKLLNKYGEESISKIYVFRTPLRDGVRTLLNILTLGDFDEKASQLNYEKVFHLGLFIELEGVTELIKIEKNELLNVEYIDKQRLSDSGEILRIPLKKKISLENLILQTRKRVGDEQFFHYSAYKNNCQRFVSDILRTIDVNRDDWVLQNAEELVTKNVFVRQFMLRTTDLAAVFNKYILGGGKKKINQ